MESCAMSAATASRDEHMTLPSMFGHGVMEQLRWSNQKRVLVRFERKSNSIESERNSNELRTGGSPYASAQLINNFRSSYCEGYTPHNNTEMHCHKFSV